MVELSSLMLNHDLKTLIRAIKRSDIGEEYFLEKGLKELREVSRREKDILTDSNFNQIMAVYQDVMLDISERMDVSEYKDRYDSFIEELEQLEGEIKIRTEIEKRESLERKRMEVGPGEGGNYEAIITVVNPLNSRYSSFGDNWRGMLR